MNTAHWSASRLEQYAKRTDMTILEARLYLNRIFNRYHSLEAIDAKIDPVVDTPFKSVNRPVYFNTYEFNKHVLRRQPTGNEVASRSSI